MNSYCQISKWVFIAWKEFFMIILIVLKKHEKVLYKCMTFPIGKVLRKIMIFVSALFSDVLVVKLSNLMYIIIHFINTFFSSHNIHKELYNNQN